jgi:N-methylhydantoinase A/oxoprolinase/acetone carboxylase beta subunit
MLVYSQDSCEVMAVVGIDVGGTFTDLYQVGAGGGVSISKVPSTPGDPARGP